jgi:hypothetical protein
VVLTPNSKVAGSLRLVAHERQSYDIHVELQAPPIGPGMPAQQVGPVGVEVSVTWWMKPAWCCSEPAGGSQGSWIKVHAWLGVSLSPPGRGPGAAAATEGEV